MTHSLTVQRSGQSTNGSPHRTIAVSLPALPFAIEVDPLRSETAPRGNPSRLPPRKPRPVMTERCLIDGSELFAGAA